MKKDKSSIIGTPGSSALMVIFAVLCLAVFAVLALSGALAGQRLENASAESITAYYEADAEAEAMLAQIRGGDIPDGVEKDGNVYSWSCPIGNTRQLLVKAEVKGKDYKILQWQTAYAADWTGDDSLNLWDGLG